MILKNIFTLIVFLLVLCFPVVAQNMDSPRKGEGIHAFLRRNKRTQTEHYQQFLDLNEGKFGKDKSLLLGVKYKLPPLETVKIIGTRKKEPLFGKKWEEYTIESDKLAGACFYLSSGHGGPDCGAIGYINKQKLHEDEYAYDITLRLARCLLIQGATVHIIIQDAQDGIRDDKYLANNNKETCMGSAIPNEQIPRLKQRCDCINKISKKTTSAYQRAIFIHLDSRKKAHQTDVYFFYSDSHPDSKKTAEALRKSFDQHYQKYQPGRGFSGTVKPRGLYVLSKTDPVPVFAELGNIQNTQDQKRFILSTNRQALADWLCAGFIKDYENFKRR